ncbi:MAG: hypothetical protein K8M05_14440, partial [Deltaproteobacteria bacterium]|nr:hypothetical protein [Kofleriaceae bacterium]
MAVGGRLHRDPVRAFAGYQDLKVEDVLPAMLRSVGGVLDELDHDEFALRFQTDSSTAGGNTLTHVSMQQTVGGVPIVGTNVGLTLRPGVDSHGSRLLASSYRVYVRPEVDTAATVVEQRATEEARARLGAGEVTSSELVIRKLGA